MMWCPVVHIEDSAEAWRARNRCRWNSESFYWRREAGTENQNLMILQSEMGFEEFREFEELGVWCLKLGESFWGGDYFAGG